MDPGLNAILKQHIGDKKAGRVFEARNSSPISGNNILKKKLSGEGYALEQGIQAEDEKLQPEQQSHNQRDDFHTNACSKA